MGSERGATVRWPWRWWRARGGPGQGPRARRPRWYPQLPLAAAIAPFGLLLVLLAAQKALGLRTAAPEAGELESHLNPLHVGPVLQFVVGVSLLAISIGIAQRSRLAWLWCVATLSVGVALRIPPDPTDVPLALYMIGLLIALVVHRRTFVSRSIATSGVFAVVMLTSFLIWATLGTLRLGEQFEPPVKDLATALYFTVVMVSSVGFGDIVATGPEARLFVVIAIVLGLTVMATALSTILVPLISSRMREILAGRADVERSNHFVVVGASPLGRNVTLELEKRGQKVTLVLGKAHEEDFYRQRDVVVGDPTDLSVLRDAGVQAAKGVLALSLDDADNGFVVLGVNELDPNIPTVAALNDPANQFRLKRTQPSMLLSLQALGGELLAMALTGERVDVEMLTRVLQVRGTESQTQG